jgi:hypothetical protein
MEQFAKHRGGHQHLIKEFGKEVDLADQDEIADRRSIRDRDHCLEASRMAAISRSRSSIV